MIPSLESWQIAWRDSAELAERFRGLLEQANAAMRSGPLQSKIAFALKETSALSAVDRKVLKDNPTLGVRK